MKICPDCAKFSAIRVCLFYRRNIRCARSTAALPSCLSIDCAKVGTVNRSLIVPYLCEKTVGGEILCSDSAHVKGKTNKYREAAVTIEKLPKAYMDELDAVTREWKSDGVYDSEHRAVDSKVNVIVNVRIIMVNVKDVDGVE